MRNFLSLKLEPDSDGTCELHGSFEANRFSGHGSAWFNIYEIENLSDALVDTYPLAEPIVIEGGHWGDKKIKQLHLGLYFYSFNQKGQIICKVKMSDYPHGYEDTDNFCMTQATFITNYENLRSFGKNLKLLVKSDIEEAILEGDLNYI